MADIEQARSPADIQMFVNDTTRVHERHVPAAELNHFCLERQVLIIERGFERFAHGFDS